jgi:membrane fusion protein (multidrug efflux system)
MKAMLLSKLKITVCVIVLALMAFVVASGVAYRAVAQETKPAAPTRSAVGQAAADDLEALRLEIKALRLEIEALRKSLQATRERGKTLESKEQPRRENQKIVVTSPQAKDVTITHQYVCQIHSQRHINVRALVNGYLEKILVKEGQVVKKGDVMFKILPTLYQAKYEAAEAEAKHAELEYQYTKKLSEKKAVTANEVALSFAKWQSKKAEQQKAWAEFNFTDIKAPFDGIIDRLHEQVGSVINERDTLTTLSDNSVMWVYFNVPEASYLEYKASLGQNKEAPRIELVLANGSKFPKAGKIGAIEAVFNNKTGTIPFRADFENPDDLLRHGQTGNVLIHRTLNNALVIPQQAVFEILDKRYVYVVDKDDVVHKREIAIQNESEDIFVIKSGLDVNDKIVLEGVRQLSDGKKVEYEFRKPK